MMVTFISQCEKKALMRTRRVLDAFANRIGDNTWQTIITQEGLNAVRKLLRKTASKSTAVSCHWIRSRSRSDLLWVVGSKQKFDYQGIVPVNTTIKNILNNQWQTNWHYLPLIRVLTALAALFHDWGKATVCFQQKLEKAKIQTDPLRHEWISCLLLHSYIQHYNDGYEDDTGWLKALHEGTIDEVVLKEKLDEVATPLHNLPPLARMVMWLILTHHRLPLPNDEEMTKSLLDTELPQYSELFESLDASYGYEKTTSQIDKKNCFTFKHGLLSNSSKWLKEVKKWAGKATKQQHLLEDLEKSDGLRLTLLHARLCLMLGDHGYSSRDADENWQSSVNLFANTKGKVLKQKLDEHLVGVHQYALRISNLLPKFEANMPRAEGKGCKELKKKSPPEFSWQDKAVTNIREWSKEKDLIDSNELFGFFAINMASTGKGKTSANAKVMQALSPNGNDLRYILALGLRTLTLQTGDEYKNRIGLEEDLAVLVGSKAVEELYNQKDEQNFLERSGSESIESLLEEDIDDEENIDYDCTIPEEDLNPILKREKDRRLLYAPVLVCTIDHIMGATETIRGGRYILPTLRLMSSDLVIDEVDDFDGNDLKAIGRLIHLAGMLGRKVMLSSATIPPDLAQGFFRAYQQGWHIFARSRSISRNIGCAWIDEYRTVLSSPNIDYNQDHESFVKRRVASLRKENFKRRAVIVELGQSEKETEETLRNAYYNAIQQAVLSMHDKHHTLDNNSKKRVSFGIVRIANIAPCVALTKYLLAIDWPKDIDVKIMAYHSQQVLLIRSAQEKHLDKVLNRKKPEEIFVDAHIKQQLSDSKAKHVIYILVATPVEEVGRDHDFDWAVIEPSSYRSIIQLAGRVLRHRNESPTEPNMALLQYNLKGFLQTFTETTSESRTAVFCQPGYENAYTGLLMHSHDLKNLVDRRSIHQAVDAIPRVQRAATLKPHDKLVDLEHTVIEKLINSPNNKGAGKLEGWLSGYWWLTAIPQKLYRFRNSAPTQITYLLPNDDNLEYPGFVFHAKNDNNYPCPAEKFFGISHDDWSDKTNRLWLQWDYAELLDKEAKKRNLPIKDVALRYGELAITSYGNINHYTYTYSPQFGLVRNH